MNLTASQMTDIAVLVFLLICTIFGIAKGIFKAVIKLVVVAGSAFVGYFLSPAITPRVVKLIYPYVSDKLAVFASDKLGLNLSIFPQEQVDELLRPMLYNPVRIAVWIIVALIAFILLSIIVNIIDKLVNKTPGVKDINRTAGGILGFVIGMAICLALAAGICYAGIDTMLDEKIGDSIAYSVFTEIIPSKISRNGNIINVEGVGEIDLNNINFDGLKDIEVPVAGEKTENLVNQIFDYIEKNKDK